MHVVGTVDRSLTVHRTQFHNPRYHWLKDKQSWSTFFCPCTSIPRWPCSGKQKVDLNLIMTSVLSHHLSDMCVCVCLGVSVTEAQKGLVYSLTSWNKVSSFYLKMLWKAEIVVWKIWSFLDSCLFPDPPILAIFSALQPSICLINLFCPLVSTESVSCPCGLSVFRSLLKTSRK